VGRAGVVVLTFGWDLSRLSHGRPQSHISNRYARAHAIDHTNQYRITMPRSGLVQQTDRANDEERGHLAVPVERHTRAPRHGSS
jgi:hypothetical protein